VFVDPAQVERAVLNLVVNASDAMPEGGAVDVLLYDVLSHGDSGGHYVVVEVRDSGTGMDASTRELMFEPFFTTKGDRGTGLGLAIVQQIVHHAGGFIEVDSTPGAGTQVRLYLPGIGSH
jgi:signal transduction histidine kinase